MAETGPSLMNRAYQLIVDTIGLSLPQIQPLILQGEHAPAFFQGTFAAARTEARNRFKFLLVYLHSPDHIDTPKFCREVLCTSLISSFLQDNFILWGGSITTEEAFKLGTMLGATSFPFFGVLANFENSAVMNQHLLMMGHNMARMNSGATVLHKFQGFISSDDLLQLLTNILERYGPLLVVARTETEERERSRTLVDEQNQAFQESLRQDREKIERRQREEQRKLEEQRAIEEAERKRQEEIRLEEERKLQEEKNAKLREIRIFERKKLFEKSLPQEPSVGPDVITIMIRLYNGTKVSRRFRLDDSLKVLFDFIYSQEDLEKFTIGTHYPKKIFTDQNITLREASLSAKEVIYVDLETEN